MRELRGKEEKLFFFYSQVMTCDNKLFFSSTRTATQIDVWYQGVPSTGGAA